jgi:hypothetical protein
MGPSESRTDAELLAATSRDREAFAAFYRRYVDNVFAFFMNRTHALELAAP